jgi:hypothetical protein
MDEEDVRSQQAEINSAASCRGRSHYTEPQLPPSTDLCCGVVL